MTIRFLVAGGGCAGLSLAYHLSKTELSFEMFIFETRESYERDKTWCQWNTTKHAFQDCVVNEWNQWSVSFGDETINQKSDSFPYQMIDTGLFYDKALAQIKNDTRISLNKGTPVESVNHNASGVKLVTQKENYRGDWFIETRPPGKPSDELSQHFLGWEVEFQSKKLNPNKVTLMDFWSRHDEGVHFIYILPTNPKKGLIEATWISSGVMPKEEYSRILRNYIDQEMGNNQYNVNYQEYGVIPLETAYNLEETQNQITIGTAGGATRPSTGYTFQGIQNQVEQLVYMFRKKRLKSGPIQGWNRRELYLDAPLLKMIEDEPFMAQKAIFELFKGTNGDQLSRFMMGEPDFSDLFTVFSSMPSIPMVKYSLKTLIQGF